MSTLSYMAKSSYSGRLEKLPRSVCTEARRYSRNCDTLMGMAGSSKTIGNLREEILAMAPLKAPVVISGETGTGKELAARALHMHGKYSDGPFVALNCGALPQNMAEDI